MLKRVPECKINTKEHIPKIAYDLKIFYNRLLDEILLENPKNETIVQHRKAEIDNILDKLSCDPPDEIWHKLVPADQTPLMLEGIATMTWRFILFDEKPVFLTGDNPVFYFSNLGIGSTKSEMSFPISSHVTLWATRRPDLPEGYFPTSMAIVKEMNRRIASITTRYGFHAEDEDWILHSLAKKNWKLNRIV